MWGSVDADAGFNCFTDQNTKIRSANWTTPSAALTDGLQRAQAQFN
jgi:hypothetical protein